MKRCRRLSLLKKNEEKVLLFDDLVIEIFEKLPIKSVLRFRSLSKYWCAILKSTNFIKNHSRNQPKMLLMRRCSPVPEFYFVDEDHDVLSFHDLDSPQLEIRPPLSITSLIDLVDPNPRYLAFVVHFIGCCNGIVCLKYGPFFILCNPALRESKFLPDLQLVLAARVAFGFGVTNNNDFRVIVMHYITSVTVKVSLYSSRTNSWRQVCDAPVMPKPPSVDGFVLLNGSCHWSGRTFGDNHKTILSFNIESEVFRQLELPDCLCRHDIVDAILIILKDGCFGLIQYQKWFSESEPVEVWGMKKYGIKESWTKMFVLSPQPIARNFLPWKNDILMVYEPMFGLPEVQWMEQQGHRLFDKELNCQLTSYSLQTNQMKYFSVYGLQNTMVMVEYTESLVRLD